MKSNRLFILSIISCLLIVVLLGCASVKEVGKGFLGVSTQVLEQKRKDALKKSFALDYNTCYLKTRDILSQKDKEAYIYAQDYKEKFMALYLSPTDTTCVGIFFTEQAGPNTLIEISSPSIYAKEEIANRIFSGLAKEKSTDDQEKTSN